MSRNRQNRQRALSLFACLALAGWARGQDSVTLDVELSAPKSVVYLHESFELQLVVRSSGVRLGQNFQLQGLPPDDELRRGEFSELPARDELRGNAVQSVRRFRCDAMAMKAGTMRIAPSLELSILTRQLGFFGPSWFEQRRQAAVAPLTLAVRPLPEAGRPADFSGAVGTFSLSLEVAPAELALGDLVKVSGAIRGVGYLDGVSAPTLPQVPGFKIYAPVERAQSSSGERLFEQTIIPESTNSRVIPSVSFSFFDPGKGRYETLREGPFELSFRVRQKETFVPYHPPAQTGAKAEPAAALAGPEKAAPARDAGRIVFVTIYWLAAGGAALFLIRRERKAIRYLALLVPVVALPAFHPLLGAVMRGRSGADARFVREEAVRFGPSSSAPVQWHASSGAVVRVTETWGKWRQVEAEGDAGWVPAAALKQ